MANTSEDEVQFQSLDELFGASLDDIADLAEFETPKPGAYVLKVGMETKKINDKQAVIANFEVLETVELKNPDDVAPKPGTKFNVAFILGNNISTGRLKQFLMPFAEKFGNTNIGELIRDVVKDVQIAANITNRADKEDPEKVYAGIKNIIVA